MRFQKLHLRAFGHFSDRTLDFQAPQSGFHVIFGHNEAGKSTALRAVRNFLFGIPHASPDAFVHASSRLRIGMTLEDDAGHSITLFRRKGRKDTLLDVDERPVDEACLSPYLGGVDETLFTAMFGLDHEGLRRGGKDLLEAAGRLSESIFGAGAGAATSREVLNGLRARADELFTERGRGRKRVNQEAEEVRSAKARVVEASISARAHTEQQKALERANQELILRKQERVALESEGRRLERLIALVPSVARLHQVEQQIHALGVVPKLPAEARQWRLEALRARDDAERDQAFHEAELARGQARLSALSVSPQLLELDPKLCDDFSDRLGQHRKAERDLPKREGELSALLGQVSALLRELGRPEALEDADSLLIAKSEEYRIRRLCEELTRHETVLEERSIKARDAELSLKRKRRLVADAVQPPPPEQLKRSVQRARAQLEKKATADEFRARASQLELKIERDLSAIGRLSGPRSGLLSLQWPDEATLSAYERRFLQQEERESRTELGLRELQEEGLRIEEELRTLVASGDVPDFDELRRLRTVRDEVVGQCDQPFPPGTLVALRATIASCDNYGDRLLAEAARVSKKAHLVSARKTAEQRAQAVATRAAQVRGELEVLHDAWKALWQASGIEPGTPSEMRGWLARIQEIRTDEAERKRLSDEARGLEGDVAEARAELSLSLTECGEPPATMWESLVQLVERADDVAERSTRQRSEYLRLVEQEQTAAAEAAEAVRRVEEVNEAFKLWRREWLKVLKVLGLSKDASGDEVGAVLETLGELGRKLLEVRGLQNRISGMRRDAAGLEQDIRRTARGILEGAEDLPLVPLLERFIAAQRKALADQSARESIGKDIEAHETARRRAAGMHETAQQRLAELMTAAGASSLEELYAIEDRVDEARSLETQRSALRDDIVAQGDGAELSVVLAEVAALRVEQARARLVEVQEEKRPLDAAIEALVQQRTTAENDLARVNQGATHAAEELAASVARLKGSAAEYVRYKLAATLLEQEVERYRARHQGPVLMLANEIFPRLTRGRYSGLKPGYDKRDEQILLCVQSGGLEVEMDALSDGTRDQLFLALRLASLQHFLADRPAFPLVLDDILIHFDDERAAAALEVLSELADKTQILFFTHHHRLVELAETSVTPARFCAHDLGSMGP